MSISELEVFFKTIKLNNNICCDYQDGLETMNLIDKISSWK